MPRLNIHHQHPWHVTTAEAREIQQQLSSLVEVRNRIDSIERVAGIDVGFESQNTVTRSAVAVLDYASLELLEYAVARVPTTFPYVPGLLSFREVPAVLKALEQLSSLPQLLLCDGQGIAHQRRLGIASHLGVLLDLPTIGVAKSRLIGTHDEVGEEKGAWVELKDGDEIIGAVLRSRSRVKPLYISPGHRIDLQSSLHYVMHCITRFRLPETTRWAHRLASGPAPVIDHGSEIGEKV